jgi:hypothetical protein
MMVEGNEAMSTAKPDYTAVSVTLAARDALRDLAVVGTTVAQVRVGMSDAAIAALAVVRDHPDEFRAALAELDESED